MNRFKEASTWAGIAGILQTLKVLLPQHSAVLDYLTYAAGGLAVALPEKGSAAPVAPEEVK